MTLTEGSSYLTNEAWINILKKLCENKVDIVNWNQNDSLVNTTWYSCTCACSTCIVRRELKINVLFTYVHSLKRNLQLLRIFRIWDRKLSVMLSRAVWSKQTLSFHIFAVCIIQPPQFPSTIQRQTIVYMAETPPSLHSATLTQKKSHYRSCWTTHVWKKTHPDIPRKLIKLLIVRIFAVFLFYGRFFLLRRRPRFSFFELLFSFKVFFFVRRCFFLQYYYFSPFHFVLPCYFFLLCYIVSPLFS